MIKVFLGVAVLTFLSYGWVVCYFLPSAFKDVKAINLIVPLQANVSWVLFSLTAFPFLICGWFIFWGIPSAANGLRDLDMEFPAPSMLAISISYLFTNIIGTISYIIITISFVVKEFLMKPLVRILFNLGGNRSPSPRPLKKILQKICREEYNHQGYICYAVE